MRSGKRLAQWPLRSAWTIRNNLEILSLIQFKNNFIKSTYNAAQKS
jgi:hypothetical protein